MLYLAFGFTTWSHSGPGPAPNAPILLSPTELDQRGRLDADFGLVVSDEWELNPTLLHVLRTEFHVEFDEQALDELAQPSEFHALKTQLERICTEVPGFRIRDGIVLSTFSYARLPMVRDLQQAGAAVANHPLVAALANDKAAIDNLRAMYAPGGDDDQFRRPIPPKDEFLVLDADGTQSEVINSARAGNHLVVVGPPGTGKSQTIANLIASLAADGKAVLFVAEKRAAIDAVTKRLNQVGLGDLVLDLHSGPRSRRQIAQQLSEALDAAREARPTDIVDLERSLVRSRDRLTDSNDALHQSVPPWNLTPYELQGRLLGVDEADHSDLRIRADVLETLSGETFKDACDTLRDYIDRRRGIMNRGPWRNALEADAIKDGDEADKALDAIGRLLETEMRALRSESAEFAAEMKEPPPRTLAEAEALIEQRAAANQLDAARAAHAEANQAHAVAAEPFTDAAAAMPTDELAILAQHAAVLRGSGLSRFSASIFKRGRYRSARRNLPEMFTAPLKNWRKAADSLDALVDASRTLTDSGKRLEAAQKGSGEAAETLEQARSGHPGTERTTANAGADPQARTVLEPLISTVSAVRDQLTIAAPHAAISEPGAMNLDALESRLRDLDRYDDDAHAIPRLQQARRDLDQLDIARFADAAESADRDGEGAVRLFNAAWLDSVYRAVRRECEDVATFDADRHNATLAEFRESDIAHIAAGAQRIKRTWAAGVIAARDSYEDQEQLIMHEARKKRRHRPMSELFAAAPDVLRALKPCWAMSPLVVAQLLPASPPPFDVVIFDEASQIPPEDAISPLLRGRQAVVAGDPKQLPPTAFFRQTSDDDDEREEAEEELLTADVESVLQVMSDILVSPRANKTLGWHYRSKDERLIAFANHHVYDGRMTTFPGALADDCISHVEVPFSPRAVQQRGSNSAEVERVVQLILEHARERPGESLGVIAFGSHHANRIEETLLQERRERPELDKFFSEAADEPFFVKNLERVQGDEREAIILSVGYSRRRDGPMHRDFGPINREGGNRRLNVAITRAKRRMTIVSAFSPYDLDPDGLREGPRLLRDYIAYAASHGEDLGKTDVDKQPLNGFELDIQRRLKAKVAGIQIEPQYGKSGYRIDFAVFHPEQPGRPVLAIEADGASYHNAPSARDRDRLRQKHLEDLGWRFHRIWSTEYFRHPEREIDRAVAAWQSAVAAADAPEPEPTPEPVEPEAVAMPDPPAPQPQRGPKPNVGPKRPITEYTTRQIREVIDWVNSDNILRTEDETIQEVSRALGFQRRGTRITTTIRNAIHSQRQRRDPQPQPEDPDQPQENCRFTTRL